MFPSPTKREIRHFHVVVVQWRGKEMYKKVCRTRKVVVLLTLKALCKRTQHCWPTTPSIVGCYVLRPFAHPVPCRCVLLGVFVQNLNWTVQTLSYVQTDPTTPNIVGPAMLGVVASACTWLNYTYLLVRVGVNTDRLPLTPEKRFRPSTFLLSVLESVLKWWAFSDRFHRIRVYRRPN